MDRFNKTIKIQILVVASSNTCQMCRSCRVICNLRSKNVVLQTFEAKKRILAFKLEAWRTQKIDESQEAKFSFKVHLNISAKFGFLEFSTSADFYEKEICELVLNKNWLLT